MSLSWKQPVYFGISKNPCRFLNMKLLILLGLLALVGKFILIQQRFLMTDTIVWPVTAKNSFPTGPASALTCYHCYGVECKEEADWVAAACNEFQDFCVSTWDKEGEH